MKKLFYLILFIFIIGYLSESQCQIYINAQKDIVICEPSSDLSLIGRVLASKSEDDCKSIMKYLGYLQLEMAGFIGAELLDSINITNFVIITEVLPNSPAEESGLKKGMVIKAVDGHTVRTRREALKYLFRYAGPYAKITIGDSIYNVRTDAYLNVYGDRHIR